MELKKKPEASQKEFERIIALASEHMELEKLDEETYRVVKLLGSHRDS